jgi:hypothetical protein
MKKLKNQSEKSYLDIFKWTSKESEKLFFGANSKSKMVRIWATFEKIIFFISSLESPTYRDLMT